MSRKETVLLVSRALAIIQFVAAMLEISYLPERFISLMHRAHSFSAQGDAESANYWSSYDQVGVAFMCARIVGLLVLTVIFWNCAPWFERMLAPNLEKTERAALLREEPAAPARKPLAQSGSRLPIRPEPDARAKPVSDPPRPRI